jgi:thiamine biosynthesis lipoprotein
MGTSWHVSYHSRDDVGPPDAIQQALAEILEEVEQAMSTYRENSEISRFNRQPAGEWLELSAGMQAVLAAALQVGEQSGGAYDVTVGPLVNLWGFGPAQRMDALPSPGAIDAARARVGLQYIELDQEQGRARRLAEVSLDFSSIAKGYAVDQLAEWLLAQQITDFLVEVGGEMRLSGVSGRGDAWRVAIELPLADERRVATTIAVQGAAVATSGDYRNFFEVAGQRYTHTIDPRSGYPVVHDLASVTVLHPSAMLADAWATALSVLGMDRAFGMAERLGLAVYFIRRVQWGFEHRKTEAFAHYVADSPDPPGDG